MAKMSCDELLQNLLQFNGTANWHRHSTYRTCLYTDGIKFLVENAQADWLLDYIFSKQDLSIVSAEGFQVWKIFVKSDNSADITLENRNNDVIEKWIIQYIDFPLKEYKVFFTEGVLLLESEY